MKKRVLVLMAHPKIYRSRVNRPMFEAASSIDGVTAVDLYAQYPAFDIDVEREQQTLRSHDVLILQHPLYWYSTPAILKEWQDLVLEHGFAYGESGTALSGKTMLCALSAGGSAQAYAPGGTNRYSIADLLRPLEQTAHLCGMAWLAPFVLFDALQAEKQGKIHRHCRAWQELLMALRDDTLNLEAAADAPLLQPEHLPVSPRTA